MTTQARNGKHRKLTSGEDRSFRMAPIARAIAMALAAGSAISTVQAQQAFSGAWFAAKGGVQNTATQTGRLPNGAPVSGLNLQTQQIVSERTLQSLSNLNLAARTIAAQQAAQNAARQAALSGLSTIPDGLSEGGLKVDTNSLTAGWLNANAPTQTIANGQTTVTVQQTAGSAVLNWETFNVGRNTTLNFKQQPDWIALNKVNDPQARPSQIAGQINADGTILIVNRNGILFNGSSQINTRNLIASALPINDSLWNAGILFSNPDAKFTFSAYGETAGTKGPTEAFVAPTATASSQQSQVVVEAGAQISTPARDDNNGGRVMLIGPTVINRGNIRTPDGQAILAAGQQVAFTPHSTDANLRGLDIFVGSIQAPVIGVDSPNLLTTASVSNIATGNVSNTGIISAERGNITMVGAGVNQSGVLQSTTSVSLNGRIDLLAEHSAKSFKAGSILSPTWKFRPTETGTVTLGAGSLTQILPEYDSAARATGTSLALKSQVNVTGRGIYLGDGARILAPNADVTVKAGRYYLQGSSTSLFYYEGGQIYLDNGSLIDVSGSIVSAPASENIIEVELRGAQLADSPLQRNGFLRGKKVTVNIGRSGTNADGSTWVGTPLADASGYVGLVQRTVGQLTVDGGTVTLNAGNSVVAQTGSLVNVSNGWVDYQGGMLKTTRLLAANGGVYDISRATPDIEYVGLAGEWTRTHTRWGVTETYRSPLLMGLAFEPGYLQGGDGGRVSIQSPDLILAGALQGSRVSGQWQQTSPPPASSFKLAMALQNSERTSNPFAIIAPAVTPDVVLGAGGVQRAVPAFNPVAAALDPKTPVVLSPDLLGPSGFGNVAITSGNGDIRIASALTGAAGASLVLAGKNIYVDANITTPGGTIGLTTFKVNPELASPPYSAAQTLGRGTLSLGAGVLLSAAGQIIDARDGAEVNSLLALNGGSISLDGFNLDLKPGSVIDVSSGVKVNATGRQSKGKGGQISIGSLDWSIDTAVPRLTNLNSELRGYGTGTGGTLNIAASSIQIGGAAASPNTLLLSPEFFNQGGFSTFSLSSVLDLTVAANALIAPAVQSYALTQTTEGNALVPTLLPAAQRSPVLLTLSAPGYKEASVAGNLMIAEGASIRLDPTLSGTGSVNVGGGNATTTILGSIVAPGGSISVTGGFSAGSIPNMNVVLGSNSLLSAAGTTVLAPADARGLRQGKVLNGGSIKLSGDIEAQGGAVIDVSGTSGTIDMPGAPALSRIYVPTSIASDGGSITFAGNNGLYNAATLRAAAGAPSAAGGTLSVSVRNFGLTGTPTINLFVTQRVSDVAFTFDPPGATNPQFAIDSFASGGFDYLTLGGHVQFVGPVSAAARGGITVSTAGLIKADSAVSLSAPYVTIGQTYAAPLIDPATGRPYLSGATAIARVGTQDLPVATNPTYGTGTLSVNASLIDVGSLSAQNIGVVNMNAAGGDIRGYGTLGVQGNINLTAGQVYPTTAATFTIAAFDNGTTPGAVTVNAGGSRPLPLSAGGTLNVFASDIYQNGVLRAPLGTINLGSVTPLQGKDPQGGTQTFATSTTLSLGSGSVTSVSAVDPATGQALQIPYGTQQNGTSWIDPYGNDITTSGVPSKAINIAGKSVTIGSGAVLDLSGGGDLVANNWVKGLGGGKDILASSASFAILPGYQAGYAPLTSITLSDGTVQAGWNNNALAVGDRVWLNAGSGLAAGYYTLLPARYALLPGAYLVTPKSGTAVTDVSLAKADGSGVVSGYRGNTFIGSQSALPSIFEVASSAIVNARAQYDLYGANQTLRASALANDAVVPRLPTDAGQLVLSATNTLDIKGRVSMGTPSGGLGGLVDISTPSAIVINASGSGSAANTLYLSATGLSAFGAESMLIGGTRSAALGGLAVDVKTNSIELANDAASVLSGPEIVLVSKDQLKLDPNSAIAQNGSLSGAAQTLLFGTTATAGSGNGALLRVSSDPAAQIARSGVQPNTTGNATVGAGVNITGNNIILDSTGSGQFDPTARLSGQAVSLGSGRISLIFDNPGSQQPISSLALPNAVLRSLQDSVNAISLLSYSSIDLYGTGTLGGVDANGRPAADRLTLKAGGIRGFNNGGGAVTFNAKELVIDNSPGAAAVAAVPGVNDTPSGRLVFNSETTQIGSNGFNVVGYSDFDIAASGGMLLNGNGSLKTVGNLTVSSSRITTGTGASQTLEAAGTLAVNATTSTPSIAGGLGGNLTLKGARVDMNGNVYLPSGTITLQATGTTPGSDVNVGGTLDASGTVVSYADQVRYTSGGKIILQSDSGSINLGATSLVNLGAQAAGGDAGSLTVTATKGIFTAAGTLTGQASANGTGGRFILDIGSQPTLAALNATLDAGGFDAARTIRVRTGNVLVDGAAKAANFRLAADSGAITVSGTIDASGKTGGQIGLYGYNGVTLQNGSLLTVAAEQFDAAGKGGRVDIESGQAKDIGGVMTPGTGWIDLQTGSTIDLSVAGGSGGVLHLRAPQTTSAGSVTPTAVGNTTGGSDVAVKSLNGTIRNAASVITEGFQIFDLTSTGGSITTTARNNVVSNAAGFATNTAAITNRLLSGTPNAALGAIFHVQPGEELVNRTGDLTLPSSNNWELAGLRYGPGVIPGVVGSGEPGTLTLRAAGNLVFLSALSDGFVPGTATALSNTLLPDGSRSWSYRLVAGADLTGAEFRNVMPLASLGATSGSVQVGVLATADAVMTTTGTTASATTATGIQSIRTGTGDIDIAAGRDVQVRNQFATIYTAGTRVTPGITNSTLNPGGSVNLAASVPLYFPSGTAAGTVTATVDGVVNITNPTTGLQLPAGTVYTFANGFSNNVTFGTLQMQLATSEAGATITAMPVGASISGFVAGTKINVGGGSNLQASRPGFAYDVATGQTTAFKAGDLLPTATYIIFNEDGGTLTNVGTTARTFTLPVGNFTLAVPDTTNYFKFSYLPVSSSLRLLNAGQIDYSPTNVANIIVRSIATVPLAANASMTLPANSSVTLSGKGSVSLAGGSATTVSLPLTDAAGNTYLFDTPVTGSDGRNLLNPANGSQPALSPGYSAAQYSAGGGNVNISAGNDIIHIKGTFQTINGVATLVATDDSSQQMPVNWLYRRSSVSNGMFNRSYFSDMASTTWWVDYSNFFEGVGTFGGGNLAMQASRDVKNIDGVVATNAWMSYATVKADGSVDSLAPNQKLTEYGGGNLVVAAGRDINAGVYYVEKGHGKLDAGREITTNKTRVSARSVPDLNDPIYWLPTTLFLGKGSFDLNAGSNILLGAVANPFMLPQGMLNGTWLRSYFSTYDATDSVNLSSLAGNIVFKESDSAVLSVPGTLEAWFKNVLNYGGVPTGSTATVSSNRPWLRLTELLTTGRQATIGDYFVSWPTSGNVSNPDYGALINLMPPSLKATAFSGDIRIGGQITLAPSPAGTVNLVAAGSIDGLQKTLAATGFTAPYSIGKINLSDVDPDLIPSITAPMDLKYSTSSLPVFPTSLSVLSPRQSLLEFTALFAQPRVNDVQRSTLELQHDSNLLHRNDPEPVILYAGKGDITGLQLYSPKRTQIFAANDIADVAFYLQNVSATDVSQVIAGRDIAPFNEYSKKRRDPLVSANPRYLPVPSTGDIWIGGPGSLEVLAGRNLSLGGSPTNTDTASSFIDAGWGKGLMSIGNTLNPHLPADGGASITAGAGLGLPLGSGLASSNLKIDAFIGAFLNPVTAGEMAARYLPELGKRLNMAGSADDAIWTEFSKLPAAQQARYALDMFYLALRDAGRDHNKGEGSGYGTGYDAIAKLFPGDEWKGDINLTGRMIRTDMGGDINLLAPGGKLLVGYDLGAKQPLDQGIMTLSSGNISIFTKSDVTVGTSRIFTFKGGNEIIWSTLGNIAAGSASKTLQSAPPLRFIIDPTTGVSSIDISGIATGGGIGVLQTVKNAPPGDIDLIAPSGFIDAGDAGIRASGNLNVAALTILNADNIQVAGKSTGVPVMAAVNTGALTNASAAASQAVAAAQEAMNSERANERNNSPSVFTVRVLGFGNE